ncbi:fimbria/pilus outer membrane usher protein [Stenotrophomonas sp. HITSZ_GD]|uniref:fimbria/pilus outer membrane usher protein n=1 Tax=Stenotrophomonas sp. HITSZ_GD TaxID=3037248 RepID=UPI00240D242D|nr:fimbria/pilus outer membrane usher protein [Stenotrophomonas sp. HITSZ_GD]MDG2526775.1 fimbria/pilus outer membrane usher protein [Stenotrophomonas sp. HITSZ_GD]
MLLASGIARALAAPAGSGGPAAEGAFDAADLPAMLPVQAPQTQTLYLEVTLNDRPRGLMQIVEREGRLQARVSTLRDIGFALPGRSPDDWLPLQLLEGVIVQYDAAQQRLSLTAPWSALTLPPTRLGEVEQAAASASASPGVLLNYDLYAHHAGGDTQASLGTELRVFGLGNGVLRHTMLSQAYTDPAPGHRWRHENVRLDTTWQFDFPHSALSLQLGDFYAGFLDWSRTVRLGGIQIGRNFALQPYRVLTPTPTFLGEATVPSNVELYVEGLRQYSGEVPAGPFQLASQPGINGAGNAQLVVTDAFGRVRTLDFALYGTPQLLAKGLTDWSLGVGRMRADYGLRSFAYDQATVASASLRRGVSDQMTLEAHAEGGGGVGNAGVGGAWLLGLRGGVASASYARSRYRGLRGGQYGLDYEWNNRVFNVNLGTLRTHGDYRDLGALQGSLPATASDHAVLGVNLPRVGALSVGYVALAYPQARDARYVSAFWSRNFARSWSASLSLSQNLDDDNDRSAYLTLATTLGAERQLNLAAQRNGDRQALVADLSRPLPGDGDAGAFGWRVQASAGDDGGGGLAEIGWLNDAGRYAAGAARQGGDTYAYASASGSLVWMGPHVFAARDIQDAFAVVDTGGYPNVPVRLENRLVGVTDEHGVLLVTPLRSWQRNRLSIDTLGLPANVRVARVEDEVTPRQQAGVRVDFRVEPVRAALLTLHDAQGQPLPLGSRVRQVGAEDRGVIVGYDGQAYLDTLQPHNVLRVDGPQGRCRVAFDYPTDTVSEMPRIGPLRCLPEAP